MRSRMRCVQPAQVFVLVPERLAGLAAALADALGQLDHLVDRLLAVEPHDVVERQPAHVGPRSRPAGGGSISTNIGTMTSGQPCRISDSVPSKSNSTWLISGRGRKLVAELDQSTEGHRVIYWRRCRFHSFSGWLPSPACRYGTAGEERGFTGAGGSYNVRSPHPSPLPAGEGT